MAVANCSENMRNEFSRYASFSSNSNFHLPSGVWALQLAGAGFCRTEACSQWEVICFSCGLKLDVRTLSRRPVLEVHRLLTPTCSFVTGTSDNQPIPTYPAVSSWLTQNFLFPIPQVFTITQSGSSQRNGARSLQEQDQTDRHPDQQQQRPLITSGPLSQDLVQGLANPVLEDFTLARTVAELGSDSSFLLSTTTFDFASAPSLPSDFFTNFQNMTQDDTPSFTALPLENQVQFPEEVLVTDGEAMEPIGNYPDPDISNTEVHQYKSAVTPGEEKKTITFEDLGIIVQRPKRQDLASLPARLQTFHMGWSSPSALSTKEQLAEAGFYYAGYADCCRCFYCGGGLKNWEAEDHPWIEHARWFKTCPYVRSSKGPEFIDAVQSLAQTNAAIHMEDVVKEIDRMLTKMLGSKGENTNHCETSEADPSLLDNLDDIDDYQTILRNAEELETENEELVHQKICKICLDKEACILYVPCGHLVTCSLCAPSVRECPVCRQKVQGQIRTTSVI